MAAPFHGIFRTFEASRNIAFLFSLLAAVSVTESADGIVLVTAWKKFWISLRSRSGAAIMMAFLR